MQKSFSTQPGLLVSARDLEHPILHALDDTEALLDGSEIERLLSSIYSSGTDRPSYPLLTLFRSLLLGIWYRLSDVQLAQALYRDLLFRKFCRLELGGNVPEASTLWRAGMLSKTVVAARSRRMAFQCIRRLMKMASFNANASRQEMCMTPNSATLCCWAMKRHCMRMLRNERIAVTRSTAERPFATYKLYYGLALYSIHGFSQECDGLRTGGDGGKYPKMG